MIIKLKLSIFLLIFLISNVISTLVMLFPAIAPLSLFFNFIMIIYGILYLFYQKKPVLKKGFIFYLYSFWVIVMICNGFSFDIRILGRLFSNPESAFILLFPLLIYKPLPPDFLKTIIKYLIISNILFLVFIIIGYSKIIDDLNFYEFISKKFAYGNIFLLLLFGYLSPKKKLLSILIFSLTFFISLYLARRAQAFYLGISGLAAWYVFVFYFKKKYIFINILLGMLLVSSAIFFNADQFFESHFSKLTNRINDDTRSVTEEDFYNDMTVSDWIVGKGINGKFKVTFNIDEDYAGDTRSAEDKNYRYGIETGYLNTILKGGIVKLALDLLIILSAIFSGLFYGKNLLVKASVFFLLTYLATLYPENANIFSYRYLLVWICVAICFNRSLRKLDNSQLYKQYLV